MTIPGSQNTSGSSRLQRPLREVGIVGYGAYLPRYRLPAAEIARVWTGGMGGAPIKEKSVPGLDEDVVTMSIERSEEHTSELQSRPHLVCRLLLEKKKTNNIQ